MKELTTEQKAQRYDEALEKSKRLYEQGTITESLCYVFPELAESEDERIRKDIVFYIAANHKDDGEKARWLYWLEKQGQDSPVLSNSSNIGKDEQKPAWSEEDEKSLLELSQCCDLSKTQVQWLLSLKDRVQPKQGWSEEDKKRIEQICDDLKSGMINFYANEVVKGLHYKEIIESNIDWLKSLRPRNTWKPTEEYKEAVQLIYDEKLIPFKDGNQWCFLLGYNIQEGVCGFGDSILEAALEFYKEYTTTRECIGELSRPQSYFSLWKPSDEQMEALEHFIVYHNGSTNYAKDLEELRLQLKKLMEE